MGRLLGGFALAALCAGCGLTAGVSRPTQKVSANRHLSAMVATRAATVTLRAPAGSTCSITVRAGSAAPIAFPSLRAGSGATIHLGWTVPAQAPQGTWHFTSRCTPGGGGSATISTLSTPVTVTGGGDAPAIAAGTTTMSGGVLALDPSGRTDCAPVAGGGRQCFADDPYDSYADGTEVGSAAWYAVGLRPDLAGIVSGTGAQFLSEARTAGVPTGTQPVVGSIAVAAAGAGAGRLGPLLGYVTAVAKGSVVVDVADYAPLMVTRDVVLPAADFAHYIYGGPTGNGPGSTPAAIDDPVPATAPGGALSVFAVDGSGDLLDWTRSGSTFSVANLTTTDVLPKVVGGVTPFTDPDGLLSIVATGRDGHLYEFSRSTAGGWSSVDLTTAGRGPDVLQGPAPIVQGRRLDVFATADDGRLVELSRSAPGAGWHSTDVGASAQAPSLDGAPSVATGFDGRLTVLAAGSDGDAYAEVDTAGQWTVTNITRRADGPKIVGTPRLYHDSNGDLDVLATALNGDLTLFFEHRNGSWGMLDITVGPKEPTIIASPWPFTDPNGQFSVMGRSTDGDIYEFFRRRGVWSAFDVSHSAHGPTTIGDPRPFANPDGLLQAFSATSGGQLLGLTRIARGRWRDAPIQAAPAA